MYPMANVLFLPTRLSETQTQSTDIDNTDSRSEVRHLRLRLRSLGIPTSHIHPVWVSCNIFFLTLFLYWRGTILLTMSVYGLVFGHQATGVFKQAQKSTFKLLNVLKFSLRPSLLVSWSFGTKGCRVYFSLLYCKASQIVFFCCIIRFRLRCWLSPCQCIPVETDGMLYEILKVQQVGCSSYWLTAERPGATA